MRFSYIVPVGTLVQYRPWHNEEATPRRKRTDRELRLSDFHCKDSRKFVFKIDDWHLWVVEAEKVEVIPNTPKRGGFRNGML